MFSATFTNEFLLDGVDYTVDIYRSINNEGVCLGVDQAGIVVATGVFGIKNDPLVVSMSVAAARCVRYVLYVVRVSDGVRISSSSFTISNL